MEMLFILCNREKTLLYISLQTVGIIIKWECENVCNMQPYTYPLYPSTTTNIEKYILAMVLAVVGEKEQTEILSHHTNISASTFLIFPYTSLFPLTFLTLSSGDFFHFLFSPSLAIPFPPLLLWIAASFYIQRERVIFLFQDFEN